jgi:hypothetical protein
VGYARQHLKKKGAKSERARAPEANPAKQAATAPCSHLWLDGAEAGAGAMLVACRLAGLSALEGHHAGPQRAPAISPCAKTEVQECERRRNGWRGARRGMERARNGRTWPSQALAQKMLKFGHA